MADPLPIVYRKSADSVISYNYTDIASGTGVQLFYLGETYVSAIKYKMSHITWYSDRVMSNPVGAPAITVTPAIIQTLTFNVKFLQPVTVSGDALANIAVAIRSTATAVLHHYIIATASRYDGSSDTDLVSATGSVLDFTSTGANQYGYGMDAITLAIPKTKFKIGDELRLKLVQYGYADANANAWFIIAHDPKGRATSGKETIDGGQFTFGTSNSISTLQVPFVLEI